MLLVSWAAWKQGLPKGLNVLGLISGVAGVVTIAPALEEVGAVFGLGMIVWFVWIGVLLLREAHGETKPDPPLTRQST